MNYPIFAILKRIGFMGFIEILTIFIKPLSSNLDLTVKVNYDAIRFITA